jgi:HAD superfamily hydrolase (TIGR01509 family)
VSAPFGVGFDFDHTLGLDHGLEVLAFERLAAERGVRFEEAMVKRELARFRNGAQSMTSMVTTIAGDGFAGRWEAICLELVERVTPIDGARDLLATLAERGIPTAILTNGWSPLQEAKIARALGFRGKVLVSEAIGVRKPEAAAFSLLVGVLGVSPDRCFYVGDNPEADVIGAQAAGLRGVWFDWEGVAYPPEAPPPFARIGALADLLAVVPGHAAPAENIDPPSEWAR